MRRLIITNYKNLISEDFELSGINIFCGDNGVGKTNVLKAIEALWKANDRCLFDLGSVLVPGRDNPNGNVSIEINDIAIAYRKNKDISSNSEAQTGYKTDYYGDKHFLFRDRKPKCYKGHTVEDAEGIWRSAHDCLSEILYYSSENCDGKKKKDCSASAFTVTQFTKYIQRLKGNDKIFIENPEIGLSSISQRRLGTIFYDLQMAGIQVFIETVSQHIIEGLLDSNFDHLGLSIFYKEKLKDHEPFVKIKVDLGNNNKGSDIFVCDDEYKKGNFIANFMQARPYHLEYQYWQKDSNES